MPKDYYFCDREFPLRRCKRRAEHYWLRPLSSSSRCNGRFALLQQALPSDAIRLQLLVRHRRDLVRKSSALCCQIREHLHQMMPAYAELFEERLWTSTLAMPIAIRFHSAQAVLNPGLQGMESFLREAEINFQRKSQFQIIGWAKIATPPDPDAELRFTMLESLYGDLCQKKREISLLEVGSVELLAATPYLLLMAIPGINNVITAAELAGKMGPITDYANANAIIGDRRFLTNQCNHQLTHGSL